MSTKKNQRIFVYGTLKNGFYFHDSFLGGEKSVFLGKAVTSTDFTLYIDSLPNMVREVSDNGVKGEVYEVSEEVLKALDKLEGHPNFYKRDMIEVNLGDDKKINVWAYVRPYHYRGREYATKEEEFT